MSTEQHDSPAPQEAAPTFTVPNFKEDERARVRYAQMLERRKKEFARAHEASLRSHAAARREELREALNKAQRDWTARTEAANETLEAYRAVCPHHAKRLRLKAPSWLENLKTKGAANKLYLAAKTARETLIETESETRKLEHNEGQLEIELKKALERAPSLCAEIVASAQWLEEVHAEEDLGPAKTRLDEIDAERAAYAARLAAGAISDDELRLRAFAERDVRHVEPSLDGVIFESVATFGERAWYVLRDLRGRAYALPYDPRLEPLVEGVYDVAKTGSELTVRPHTLDGRSTMPLGEFFRKTIADEEDAQAAFARQRAFAGEARAHAANGGDEIETEVIEAFAALLTTKAA